MDLSKLFYIFLALSQRKPSTMHPFTSCNLPTWLVPCRLNATLLNVTVLKIFYSIFMCIYFVASLKWDMWTYTMETSDMFCMVPKFQLHSAQSDIEMNSTPGTFNCRPQNVCEYFPFQHNYCCHRKNVNAGSYQTFPFRFLRKTRGNVTTWRKQKKIFFTMIRLCISQSMI